MVIEIQLTDVLGRSMITKFPPVNFGINRKRTRVQEGKTQQGICSKVVPMLEMLWKLGKPAMLATLYLLDYCFNHAFHCHKEKHHGDMTSVESTILSKYFHIL